MPRDASGSYTLPAGNPVVTGSIIQTSWANPTMDDIRTAMTDSLSRSGKGGMLAPFTVPDGSNINPSLSFVNEATSGLYRFANNDIRMAVGTTDRMRWQGAGTPPQIYDEVNDRWNDLGAGGVEWSHAPVIPAEVEQGVGYMTNGGQSTNMPPSPITGQAVTFADLDNDWSATNFLTINGNGNTFTQGNQAEYELDLKGAYAQFAYLDGQWQIVNFGRLSDAYGFDLDDYATKVELNNKPNENLLYNGNFKVNQEGFAGGQPAAGVYGFDGWLGSPDGLQIQQIVENDSALNGVYTISWQGGTGTATVEAVTGIANGGSVTLSTSTNFSVIVPTDATKIKFELGSVATPYQEPKFRGQLADCQRYLWSTYPYGVAAGTPNSFVGTIIVQSDGTISQAAVQTVQWPTMRVIPIATAISPSTGVAGLMRSRTSGIEIAAGVQDLGDSAGTIFNGANNAVLNDNYTVHVSCDARLYP